MNRVDRESTFWRRSRLPRRICRAALHRVVTTFLRCAPRSVAVGLAQRTNRVDLLPPGRSFRTRRFLGSLTMECDCVYPIEREILRSGVWDREIVEIIRQFVRPSDVCMDLGANIGSLTLAMAQKTGRSGTVYAFEPGPTLTKRFKTNVALNPQFRTVIVLAEVGLSDKPGTLFWNEDMANRGNGGLLESSGQPVEVTTVDEFAQRSGLKALHFVKIDVEGMEYEVLKGGLATWKRFKPVLCFETLQVVETHLKRPVFRKIELMLSEIGYELYKYRGGEVIKTTSNGLANDTLAVPVGLDIKAKLSYSRSLESN